MEYFSQIHVQVKLHEISFIHNMYLIDQGPFSISVLERA